MNLRYLTFLFLLTFCFWTSAKVPAAEPRVASVDNHWEREGQSRYGWQWLASRFDPDGDGVVAPTDIPLEASDFARLDQSWDGRLTADDFDWSRQGRLCQRKESTFALFKLADQDSNGELDANEWQTLFSTNVTEHDGMGEADLQKLLYEPQVIKTRNEQRLRSSESEFSPASMLRENRPPPVDSLAPDFALNSSDGKTTIRLADYRGKRPVVLIFGCFTCGNYRVYSQSMEALWHRYRGEAEFVRVYIREAHPASATLTATGTNARAGILIPQPTTFQERCAVADRFVEELKITTPVVVDELDNRVGQAYSAWPDRLFIVDRQGKIAFAGGQGPFGFNPSELEQSLIMLRLEEQATPKTQ